jgi:hypothetical protein
MRTMQLHNTSRGFPDYFYCTECGWVHTEALFKSECDPEVAYRHEVAEAAFKKHRCPDYAASACVPFAVPGHGNDLA